MNTNITWSVALKCPLALTFWLLFSFSSIAQVAFVGSADGTGNFTIPSGTNRLLLVQSCAFGTSGSPMFNGMPLTLALRRSAPVAGDLEIWYLSIPGTASVTSSVSGLAGTPHSSWYSGVDPTNPIAGMTSRSGSGTSSSLMLPALADGIIYSGVFRKDGDAINPGGGQTETFDAIFNSSSSRCEGSYKTSVAGANTVSVTGANGFTMAVAHIAVFIQKPCVDAVAPTIMCPGAQNVFFDASCQASLPNYISSTTVSDDCDVAPVVTQSPTAGTMISMPTSVTMTAMDASGKSSMCSFTVTPVDNTSPTLTCPGNMSVSNAGGTCGAVVNYTTPMASDNCGVVGGVSCVPASGYTFPVGTTTVTCTASDAAGNMGTCTFTVTVNDTEDPVIGSCPGTVMVSNTPGLCSGFATFTAPMATDNCPGVSVSCSPASGSNFPVGNNTVTCTATDAAGNTDVCTFTVTVNDTEAPSIMCPTNITMSNDAGMCGAVVTFTPTATDNCPGVTYTCVPASGTLFPVGTTTVTCTATDAAGNMDVCTFTVTVNDMEDPNITCPSNITVSNDAGMCGAVVTFTPTAADNCPGVTYTCVPASGTLFPVGTTTVTCTATDASGNMEVCTFTVTVNDTEDPNITCPANITVSNDAGMCGAVVTYTTPTPMDNCTGVSVSCVPASGTFFAVGTTTVNCTATDMAGNTTTCMFDVTVSDTAAPGWEIASMGMPIADNNTMSPATETYDLGVIECDSTSIFTASGVDNCDGPITPSNALQLVSLTTVNGSAVLPSSIAITDDAMGNYSLAINWGVGTTTIVLSMSDALGNSSNLTLTATTIDTEPPFWQITDESMLRIADNDPLSPEPLDADLGMLTIDQNECGAMGTYFASGVDSCEGAVTSSMALSIVSIVSGSAVSPTTATLSNDGSGNYTIIVSWGVGTSTVSLALQDGSGNAENLSLTATVPDPFAGNIQPNANGINPAMDQNGDVSFQLFEIVRNASCSDLVDVVIETMSGVRVYSATGLIRNSLITFNACPYRGQQLKATFTASGGSAWGYITIKSGSDPIIDPGTSKDIYCFDSLILSEPSVGDFPKAYTPCGAQLPVSFVADWIEVHDCSSDQFSSENDTLKVIYREYEAFDKNGRRTTSTDTFTVFRMPAIDVVNTPNVYCSEKDTFYCGVGNAGPYMVYSERCDPLLFGQDQDTDGSVCDTFYFLTYNDSLNRYLVNPLLEKSKCGILLHLDYLNFEKNSCDETTKYTLEIKQECIPSSDVSCFVDPLLQASNAFEEISQGYFKCEFWTINLDTLPPLIDCKDDNLLLTTVYTGTHDCSANTYVPPAYVNDDWSGVKQVKATIEDIGTAIMTFNPEKKCYEGHTPFKLPHRVLPYKVLYEAYDSCHNIGYDSCYIRVKDGTDPIAISDKGVTVSLSNKKVWVEAKTFDEGSWDNCGINMLLARRSDWYDFCINLCDSIDDCWVGEHGDTIWQSILQEDKHLDEVEAHYAKTLEWLCEDNQACGDVIYNAWQYDLMKHATLDCIEHPYEVGEDYFRGLIKNAVLDPVFARKWKNPSTLFIGSANNPAGADNNAYYVSMNGSATNVLDAFPIWGATTDFEQKRILFSTSFESDKGDQLYALPFGGVAPVKIGTITSDGTTPLRMDGLAFKDGKLYGALDNGTNDGIFIIDLSTLIATKIITYSDISGIDTDPISGKIYGADDGSRKIVEINVTNNSITAIADYPAGVTDIDGVAVGNGKIFLVTDEPGFIYVYNLASKAYDAPIISPFGEDDTFSGGAAYMPVGRSY